MMLATAEGTCSAPQIEFAKQPVGVEWFDHGLVFLRAIKGLSAVDAFGHAHNAAFGVLKLAQDATVGVANH